MSSHPRSQTPKALLLRTLTIATAALCLGGTTGALSASSAQAAVSSWPVAAGELQMASWSGGTMSIAVDQKGNIYTTNTNQVPNQGSVSQITPSGVVNNNWLNLGGSSQPSTIAVGPTGNIYVAYGTSYNGAVAKVTASGAITNSWASLTGYYDPNTGAAGPIVVDSYGNVYVIMPGGLSSGSGSGCPCSVAKITPAGVVNNSWASINPNGATPTAMAIGPNNNIFVASQPSSGASTSTVTKITPAGTVTQTWASLSATNPQGIAVDSSGNVYTANYSSNSVSKITPAGAVTQKWATTGSNPTAITVDSSNNLYTANYSSNTVTKITPTGIAVTNWGSTGLNPLAIAVGPQGGIYTANLGPYNLNNNGYNYPTVSKLMPLNAATSGSGNGTVTTQNGTINCTSSLPLPQGNDCTGYWPLGTQVTLTANPGASSALINWTSTATTSSSASPCITSTPLTCTVLFSQAMAVTAVFNLISTPVNLKINIPGAYGTITGSRGLINCGAAVVNDDCSQLYQKGSIVTLTAKPAAGLSLISWSSPSGACAASTSNTCVVTMSQARSITANFVAPVGAKGPGGGTVFYASPTAFTETGAPCGSNCHNLEVAPAGWYPKSSPDPQLIWCSKTNSITALLAEPVPSFNNSPLQTGYGYANTVAINADGCGSNTAASAAAAYAGNGYKDWFLPSLSELFVFKNSGVQVGVVTSSQYWSSCQSGWWFLAYTDTTTALTQTQGGDGVPFLLKTQNAYVRPIRAF